MSGPVGRAVTCTTCGHTKKPIGRDAGWREFCDFECPGYRLPPHPGNLWPGETAETYGYPGAQGPSGERSEP